MIGAVYGLCDTTSDHVAVSDDYLGFLIRLFRHWVSLKNLDKNDYLKDHTGCVCSSLRSVREKKKVFRRAILVSKYVFEIRVLIPVRSLLIHVRTP